MKEQSMHKRVGVLLLVLTLISGIMGCASSPKPQSSESNNKLVQESAMQQNVQKQQQKQRQHKNPTPSVQTANTTNHSQTRHMEEDQPVTLLSTTKPVRAIYVSSHVANSSRMNQLIDLVNKTELNAMVLDINSGVTLSSPVRSGSKSNVAQPVLSNKRSAQHFRQVIKQLKQQHIYLIARIVTFKDPVLANGMPAWAIKRKDGKIWRDRSGTAWIDPYRQEAWEYSLALAEQAVQLGFDEIQFDYVRFPENATKVDREVAYANTQNWSKSEAIRKFLHRANLRMHKYGVKVSADVFGMVSSSNDDMGIGQKWDAITKEVDVISPMVYPSHYSKGMWGIANPDLSPGRIITRALEDANRHNRKLNQQGVATAKVRPWLQGFTAGWVHPHQKYGGDQIREQIVAARKAGIHSYMIWNSSNRYPKYTT